MNWFELNRKDVGLVPQMNYYYDLLCDISRILVYSVKTTKDKSTVWKPTNISASYLSARHLLNIPVFGGLHEARFSFFVERNACQNMRD